MSRTTSQLRGLHGAKIIRADEIINSEAHPERVSGRNVQRQERKGRRGRLISLRSEIMVGIHSKKVCNFARVILTNITCSTPIYI